MATRRIFRLTTSILFAAVLGLHSAGATHAASTTGSRNLVLGGMSTASEGGETVDRAVAITNSSPTQLPSCEEITYRGDSGEIYVRMNPDGYVAWGGRMYDPADEPGHYFIEVLVNGKRQDRKNKHYDYFPHASLPPSHAPSGSTFSLDVDLQADNGKQFHSVPNECRVP